jgi:signal transduction histidine kinase/DNA-binding response OmpR family regulator
MVWRSMKVLLVEDNAGDARLLRDMFSAQVSHNTTVTHVESMTEAERHLAEHAVDVFVLDLGLPDSQGLGAVRRAHAAAPHVPLVVLTGLDDEQLAVQALQEGAQDYLVKGQIETPGLLRAVRYAIERKIIEIELNNEVAELKRTDAELRESELILRLALDASGQGVWRWEVGQGTDSLAWDARCKALFGLPSGAMVNYAAWAGAIPAEDRGIAEAGITRALDPADTLDEYVCEYRALHPDGAICWVATAGRAVFEPDLAVPAGRRVVRILGTSRDVSHAKRAEHERDVHQRELERSNAELERLSINLARARDDAERASRVKSSFLAGMSHELRTPLNGILGYAHLLRLDGGLNVTQSARVEAMLGAGTHLLQMINRVLDLSEIEAGHVELQTAECDLREIASACLDFVRPAAEAKRLALHLVMDPEVPETLTTDPTRLRQVLVNLLGNAVKFTTRGSVRLRLRLAADRAALRFEVADTGPGISAEHRHSLFQEFERLGASVTTAVEGAGLGLAIAAPLAVLMGGRLGHEDNPGGGSVFWLELPLAAGAIAALLLAAAPVADPAACQPVPSRAGVLRVLVVDDVPMNLDIAGAFLRASGHEVSFAEGGIEAVAAVATADFDLVLMDVRMPEVDGLEATRRIRALVGTRGRVPIVALTAWAFAEQVKECLRAGMDGHLAKPFTPETLRDAVACAARTKPGGESDAEAGAEAEVEVARADLMLATI